MALGCKGAWSDAVSRNYGNIVYGDYVGIIVPTYSSSRGDDEVWGIKEIGDTLSGRAMIILFFVS